MENNSPTQSEFEGRELGYQQMNNNESALFKIILPAKFLKPFYFLITLLLIFLVVIIIFFINSFGEKPVLTIHTNEAILDFVRFVPNNNKLIAASTYDEIKIWSLESRKVVRTFKYTEKDFCVDYIAFSKDGKLLAGSLCERPVNVAKESKISLLKIWDVQSGQIVRTIRTTDKPFKYLQFDPDSNSILSFGEDGFIYFWDLTTGNMVWKRKLAEEIWARALISPDGARVAAFDGKTLFLINIRNGGVLEQYTNSDYSLLHGGMTFSKDSKYLIVEAFNEISFLDLTSKFKLEKEFYYYEENFSAETIEVTPDNKKLVLKGDNMIVVFDRETEKVIKKMNYYGHSLGRDNSLQISPDGKTIATLSTISGCRIHIWSLEPSKQKQ